MKEKTKLTFNRILKLGKEFSCKSTEDSLSAYAAQTTFFILLSFFPFVMLLLMVVNKLSFVRNNVVGYILDIVPSELKEYVMYVVDDVFYSEGYSFTIVTAIVSLWSAGKGIQSLSMGLDRIYRVERRKNYILSRLLSALYTLLFLIMCLCIMVIHTFGGQIVKRIVEVKPLIRNETILVYSMKNAFTFLVVYLMLLVMYYQLPGRKKRGKLKDEMLGAMLAALSFLALTNGFSAYVNNIINKSYMYGSMTSIIVFMIWIYVGMMIVLYGAQINYFAQNNKFKTENKSTDNVDTKKLL